MTGILSDLIDDAMVVIGARPTIEERLSLEAARLVLIFARRWRCRRCRHRNEGRFCGGCGRERGAA